MKKNKFLIILLVCFAILDVLDITSYLGFLNINYNFWSSLIIPLIIFYLGVNRFNQYQKDRNLKKDVLNKNILNIQLLSLIELSTSIYEAYQHKPTPPRLVKAQDEYEPFYILNFKRLEGEVITAFSNCSSYEKDVLSIIHDSRLVLTNASMQDITGLHTKDFYNKLKEIESNIKNDLNI